MISFRTFSWLQGDSKKTQEFSLITRTVVVYELCHEIINRLFLPKTEIHTQILNTEPFLCYFRGQRFLTNKMVLWSRKSIFILARSSSCSNRDGTGHHNWSWRGTWMTLIAPNKHSETPSYPNWSTSFIIIFISTIFQNMK